MPLYFGIEQVLPGRHLVASADQVGTDAKRVGVVDRGDEGQKFGRLVRELLAVLVGVEHRLDRRQALRRGHLSVGIRALGEERHRLAPQLVFGDRDRRQHTLAHQIGQLGAVDVVDVDGVRLRQRTVELDVVGDGLHDDLEAEVLARLFADLLDRRIGAAGMDQRHVLGGLRPHGGKSADRLGRDDRAAGRRALEQDAGD